MQFCEGNIFTTRKRSLRRLCFYTRLSFCPYGGSVQAGIPPLGPGTPPGPDTPSDQAPPRTRHPSPGPGTCPCAVHAARYGQRAGGMHPTGMQSCYILKWHLSDERRTVQVENIACFMQWRERESTSSFMAVFRIILQNGSVSDRLSLFIQSFHFLKVSEQEIASIISPTLQLWIFSVQLQNARSFSMVWLMFLNFWHICILSKQSLSCQHNSF